MLQAAILIQRIDIRARFHFYNRFDQPIMKIIYPAMQIRPLLTAPCFLNDGGLGQIKDLFLYI